MMQSESIANLAKALSIVQGKLTYAVKDSANPFFKSKYADLESVWDACRSLLAENGLAVMQFPGEFIDGCMSLTTILSHASGEWIGQEMSVPVTKPDWCGPVIPASVQYPVPFGRMRSSAVGTWVCVPITAETLPSRYQPSAIFSAVASA